MTATPIPETTKWHPPAIQRWGQALAIILLNLLSPGLWLFRPLLFPYLHRVFPTLNTLKLSELDFSTLQIRPLPPEVLLFQVVPILLCCLLLSIVCFRLTVWGSTLLLRKVVATLKQ